MTIPKMRELTDQEFERYARHLVLPEVGEEGQIKLLDSKVLVIGAGGLGSALLLYLTAAGIGTLGVVDDDVVDRSNLQRQILHREEGLDHPKVDSVQKNLTALNSSVEVICHHERLTKDNAQRIIADYDLVADGSDSIATRYLINDCCVSLKKTLVSAAIMRFDGQITTIKAHEEGNNPCYRCLFGSDQEDRRDSCIDVGIVGAVAGAMGSLQALEVIKEILGLGESLSGRLLLFSALESRFRRLKTNRDPHCPVCARP